jgi:hypothetical protein
VSSGAVRTDPVTYAVETCLGSPRCIYANSPLNHSLPIRDTDDLISAKRPRDRPSLPLTRNSMIMLVQTSLALAIQNLLIEKTRPSLGPQRELAVDSGTGSVVPRERLQ